jgi:sialidase-1
MSNQVVLQLDPTRQNSRNSEGAFVTLKSGRILFAYTKYSTNAADDGGAVIASRYSDDGGKLWSHKDRVLVQREGATNVMSVSLLRLQDGRIGMTYLRKDGHGPGQTCMPLFRTSADEGKTFSRPVSVIPIPGYYVVNNDRVIQLKSGRLVVPVGSHRYRAGSHLPKPDGKLEIFLASAALIHFYFSDDGGKSWFEALTNYYKCFPNGHGLQEPGVVELKNGHVWSWCRAGAFGIEGSHGYQWESISKDGGMNWPDARPSKFRSPCSPMSVKRIPSTGHLLAIWNDHSGKFKTAKPTKESWGRTPLVSAISKDEGKTWRHHRILEKAPDHGFCYIAIHFTDDAVLLAYCAGGASTKLVLDRLRVRRIKIEEMYG